MVYVTQYIFEIDERYSYFIGKQIGEMKWQLFQSVADCMADESETCVKFRIKECTLIFHLALFVNNSIFAIKQFIALNRIFFKIQLTELVNPNRMLSFFTRK